MRKQFFAIFVFTATVLMSLPAVAQTSASGDVPVAKLSWEPPTERQNGDPLDPATELANYSLLCDNLDTDATVNHAIPAVTGVEPYSVSKRELFPEYGDYLCKLTATDNDGLTSQPSNAVEIAYYKQPPNAPTNLMIILE